MCYISGVLAPIKLSTRVHFLTSFHGLYCQQKGNVNENEDKSKAKNSQGANVHMEP